MESATVFLIGLPELEPALTSMEFCVESFDQAEPVLQAESGHGCVLTNMYLPGMSGMELQQALIRSRSPLPVIFACKRLGTGLVVRLMQAGAASVLELPVSEDELWITVRDSLAENSKRLAKEKEISELRHGFSQLTKGERCVLKGICEGTSNKEIASRLDVSVRTVESRRSRILDKTGHAAVVPMVMAYQKLLLADEVEAEAPSERLRPLPEFSSAARRPWL